MVTNKLKSAADFLGLKKNVISLLGMVILVGLGEKMAERFLPLYLIALGGGAFSIGLLNGMDNLLSSLYSFPGGYASDRFGYKRALFIFNLVAMAGYLIVILVPSWPAVILGSIFFISWSAISLPASMDMLSKVLPGSKLTMGVSIHSLVRRIPMALGPILGGILIGFYGELSGIRIAFVVAFILAALSLLSQQLMIEEGTRTLTRPAKNPFRNFKLLSPSMRKLLAADILVRFCEQIPYAFVVVWCVSINGITPFQFGILTAIEMVTAILVYIPVAYWADKTTKKPFVVITFGFFTLFPLVLFLARSFWPMVVAFIIRGLKEFGEPTRKALIMELAPENQKATGFGVYYLFRDLVVSLAAFGGAFLWDASASRFVIENIGFGSRLLPAVEAIASPMTNFLAAFGFGLIGTLLFALFGKDLKGQMAHRKG